ncbi:LytR/AlgR family response regulator transcription factor [Flavobacterium muglaense]|uniref:Response regulator transcription factor n=1 Tax=Flavobacterium muglaense TaxID=2764716 RepID=A0A923N1U5_9FLAO|nr:LytTR family DNA-binding domain-containing protein [Flavobacterium muglaense]MBC5839291.1 response regulator transcription factor [Flavobacterium muglaense]MBC5845811.1 response regulator transcription factor [Flavobacterium muglaense]
MIRTIIIDDEYNAREFLEKLLTRYFPDKFLILEKCESVDEAIVAINKFNPELVFLDIQMPNKNGFQLFKELNKVQFEVIFTTAHSEFAIDAIKCSAFDYLLKPINYIDLLDTIRKYDEKQNKASQEVKLKLLLENIDTGGSEFNRIAFPTENGFELLKTNAILYCEADSNYCKIVCLDGRNIVLSKTLKYIEELLPTSLFQRIHKSYLVNLNYVNRFTKGNELLVELTNGETLPVSVRQKENFINAIIQKK